MLFLLVASNVSAARAEASRWRLRLGRRSSAGWPRYGVDPRFDRWLTLATLAGVDRGLWHARRMLRHRPLPHGSARFASEREIKAAGMRSKEGVLLGRKGGAHYFGGSEHVLVYAPTRAGKGVGYVIPNLLNWPGLVAFWDAWKRTGIAAAGFRSAHGQEVHLFDPLEENGRTARYNPLGYVRSDPGGNLYDDLQRIAVMLFPGGKPRRSVLVRGRPLGLCCGWRLFAETPGLPVDDWRDPASAVGCQRPQGAFRETHRGSKVGPITAVPALHHRAERFPCRLGEHHELGAQDRNRAPGVVAQPAHRCRN